MYRVSSNSKVVGGPDRKYIIEKTPSGISGVASHSMVSVTMELTTRKDQEKPKSLACIQTKDGLSGGRRDQFKDTRCSDATMCIWYRDSLPDRGLDKELETGHGCGVYERRWSYTESWSTQQK